MVLADAAEGWIDVAAPVSLVGVDAERNRSGDVPGGDPPTTIAAAATAKDRPGGSREGPLVPPGVRRSPHPRTPASAIRAARQPERDRRFADVRA
jgi:hypothetical protein